MYNEELERTFIPRLSCWLVRRWDCGGKVRKFFLFLSTLFVIILYSLLFLSGRRGLTRPPILFVLLFCHHVVCGIIILWGGIGIVVLDSNKNLSLILVMALMQMLCGLSGIYGTYKKNISKFYFGSWTGIIVLQELSTTTGARRACWLLWNFFGRLSLCSTGICSVFACFSFFACIRYAIATWIRISNKHVLHLSASNRS